MDGILLVDKPEGWTSHDVVAKVRNILKAQAGHKVKVGHTGTLDPMTTGLLILVIGNYTKRAGEFSKLDKVYEAEVTLGAISTTGDKEGIITLHHKNQLSTKTSDRSKIVDKTEVDRILKQFVCKIQQTPPAYSAIKVDGKRAYDLARKGQAVKIEPREVTVYEITDVKYHYPTLKFTAKVSSGTYIRSLAEDIGQALGTGAYLSSLRRTEVGDYKIQAAQSLKELSIAKLTKVC